MASAATIGQERTLVFAFAMGAALNFFQTEYAASEDLYRRALQYAEEERDAFVVMLSHFFLGLVRGNLGRFSEAFQMLRKGIGLVPCRPGSAMKTDVSACGSAC